jgi:hypothetical protein
MVVEELQSGQNPVMMNVRFPVYQKNPREPFAQPGDEFLVE